MIAPTLKGLAGRLARLARPARVALVLAPPLLFAVGAWVRRWMDDDGFINLRVVRNLLHGHGPVFNLGDRVEACTSPLWIGFLALLGALGAPLEGSAVYGGIVLSVAALLLAMWAANVFQPPTAPRTGTVWPVGAAIYAVLPAAWDYASSGLETGLGLLWLGGSYAALASIVRRGRDEARDRRSYAAAALFGLGPLIRPEFALYSAVWLVPLIWTVVRRHANSKRRIRGVLLGVGASAGLLPVIFELLRMGYYGTITPNTAIAKEAFRANWAQGGCYFRNFFGVYAMGWPAAAAAVFLILRLYVVLRADRDRIGFVAALLPPLAGLGQVAYVVGIGGDYMHARMFLSPVFAILLPISVVRIAAPPSRARYLLSPLIAAGAVLSCWLVVCATRLRVKQENECDIGDERGWYALQASVEAPIALPSYRGHPFYEDGQKALGKIEARCRTIASPDAPREGSCRSLYFDGKDFEQLSPSLATYPLAPNLDPRIGAAVGYGAIGIFGYLMPDSVHIIDRHGLAEPVASHLELSSRGRPGHEKVLVNSWLVARYAAPLTPEDASVAAARHALECGSLKGLIEATRAPLTAARFFQNMVHAFEYTRLRVPHDPFDAEARLCGTRAPPHFSSGGEGGSAFRWHCPEGSQVTALRGNLSVKDNVISRVQALCGSGDTGGAESIGAVGTPGPPFGGSSSPSVPFEVSCAGSVPVGIFGTKDKFVQGLGLLCSGTSGNGAGDGAPNRSASGGTTGGTEFELKCPANASVIGLEGRSGDLLDQVGIVCGP
jgi:arabinofuranosyltransferase